MTVGRLGFMNPFVLSEVEARATGGLPEARPSTGSARTRAMS